MHQHMGWVQFFLTILSDNTEHPIALALHTLTTSEQNYAQLEKSSSSDFWDQEIS